MVTKHGYLPMKYKRLILEIDPFFYFFYYLVVKIHIIYCTSSYYITAYSSVRQFAKMKEPFYRLSTLYFTFHVNVFFVHLWTGF